jgi:hypothetical protein
LLPEGFVVGAEVGDHAEGERAVVLAVYFDVAFEVPDKFVELAVVLCVQVADEVAEDVGDDVFAAEGEGRGHGGEVAGVDGAEGGGDEGARGGGGVDGGGVEGVVGDGGEERADGRGVGAGLLHGFEVELEVADGAAFVEVGLFAEDDLVDEAAAFGEGRWEPGRGGAGELRLQGFEQGHEIPDGEDVRLHEEAQVIGGADAGVERVVGEALAERSDVGFDVLDGGDGGEFDGRGHSSIIALTEGWCGGFGTAKDFGGELSGTAGLFNAGARPA